jgi:hypothetical protein
MQLPVVIDEKRFTVNLELAVDAHTDAFCGLSVRDTEDAPAVVEAVTDGIATTGAAPLALLLDNRPSNHTPEIDAALKDTIRIRATLFRPQNKAHVEGAFGLFSRVLPELVLDTRAGEKQLALSLCRLVAAIWATTLNHRPRKDRDGRSRVELYSEKPSLEQIQDARQKLRALAEKQERARHTLEQRRRPEVLALLDEHFTRLGLLDKERHVRLAIAGYPLDAIVQGLAIFAGKLRAQSLPDGADARYLLGIVRNVAAQTEADLIARALLDLRLEVRDRLLAPLIVDRDALCAGQDLSRICKDCIDRALSTSSPLERLFWLDALENRLASRSLLERSDLFRAAARRINATFAVSVKERADVILSLAQRLIPIP